MVDSTEDRICFFDELYALDNDESGDNSTNGGNCQSSHRITRRQTVLSENSDASTVSPSSPIKLTRPLPGRRCQSPLSKSKPVSSGMTQVDPISLDDETFDEDLSRSANFQQTPDGMKRRRTLPPSQADTLKPSAPRSTQAGAKSPAASMGNGTSKEKVRAEMPPKKKPTKKQRKDELPEIPEAQQILRGMVFYFVPNNDINPARRFRMKKAEQYGGVRAPEFDNKVTHVVVDRGLKWKDVLRHFNADEAPSGPAYVDENYPAECIGFRMRADVNCSRFQIDGRHEAAVQTRPNRQGESLRTPSRTLGPLSVDTGKGCPQLRSSFNLQSSLELAIPQVPQSPLNNANVEYEDELSVAIEDMKGTSDLPFDVDEDLRSSFSSDFESSATIADSQDSTMQVEKNQKSKGAHDFSTFSCMHKSEAGGVEANPNARTMEILRQMATYYDKVGDTWRTRAYRLAISELRRQPKKVMTKEEAIQLPGIGGRLADKIEEIVWTDKLKRLESASLDPHTEVLGLFLGIYGVGYAQASRWMAQGHRTLEELKAKANLTANQRIGIDHYEDFQQRIPREEVAEHANIVRKEIHKQDAKVKVIIGGSYRRGSNSSGDIDLLITKEGATAAEIKSIMEAVVFQLWSSKFLVAALATGHGKDTGSKWHGASRLPSSKIWRRIDLLYVPWDELGAALIYFTGNDIFNRSLRLLASRKNMRLNQHGLYKDVLRRPQRSKISDGTLLEGHDEKRIFEILQVPYRPPEHRIC